MKKSINFFLLLPLFAQGATITGYVKDTDGLAIQGVPVSDGYEIVVTDSLGFYQLKTDKRTGLVFISTPSGYAPSQSNVNLPVFWNLVTCPQEEDEQSNFILEPIEDSTFSFIAFADNQISNRPGEVACFNTTTVPDINASLTELRAEGFDPFLIALGDQAHDCYWKSNRYGLPEAYSDLRKLKAPLYSVMGNHDNDNTAMNDFDAAGEWRRHVGPNYYSFNRGGIHFVVLDNIEIVDNSPLLSDDGECVYKHRITPCQLEWLRKDLALVDDKSKPLILCMHAPLFYFPGGSKKYYIDNAEELLPIIQDFQDVRVLSGHTHVSYATQSDDKRIYENNYGAVCGSWWLNARVDLGNDNNICRDGTPSGYAIWRWDGQKFTDFYKGTGLPADAQFRAYDLNEVEFANKELSDSYLPGRKKNNGILVNVWGYGPGWAVDIFEDGKPLTVERVRSKDPLFILSCPIPYIEQGNELIGTVRPVYTMHLFKAEARKSDTDIKIVVKDRNGKKYEKLMQRPCRLGLELY